MGLFGKKSDKETSQPTDSQVEYTNGNYVIGELTTTLGAMKTGDGVAIMLENDHLLIVKDEGLSVSLRYEKIISAETEINYDTVERFLIVTYRPNPDKNDLKTVKIKVVVEPDPRVFLYELELQNRIDEFGGGEMHIDL
jgi:hypothetical protein